MSGYAHTLRVAFDRVDAMRWFAIAFFVIATLAIWTQVRPFPDLQDALMFDDPTRSNTVRRYVTLLIAGIAAVAVWMRGGMPVLARGVTLSLVLVFAWFAATTLMSPYRGTGLNRLALAGISIFIAMCMPLLFSRVEDFVRALGITATIAIVLSCLGVLFAPDLAIHTVKDRLAHDLAGDWRGMFMHKNELAAMAIMFMITGVLLFRVSSRIWGGAVFLSAFALLVASGGKTSILLLAPLFVFGALIARARTLLRAVVMTIACVGGLMLLTVGSLGIPSVKSFLESTLPDPTFTGRTEIWELAVEAIGKKPLAGFGYNTFWDTAQTYSVATEDSQAAQLPNAHNGFLDTAISAGLPGLALVLLWYGVGPMRDMVRVRMAGLGGGEQAFLDFLVQMWLFTLLLSVLESTLFNRGGSVWFTSLIAVACLQQWAQARRGTG